MRGAVRGLGVLLLLALGTVALLLTTARLLDPSSTPWIRLVAFTPYALVLYALLLVVALALVATVRGRRRAMPALLVLLSVAGLGAHLAWFRPQVSGEVPAPDPDATGLTVMTANVQGGRAAPADVLEVAAEEGADLLVLQEATEGYLRGLERAGVSARFPDRAGTPISGIYGTVVFSAGDLGQATPAPGELSGLSVPVATEDGEVQLVAAHAPPPVDAEAWTGQHRLLGDWVAGVRPELVVGDLNATADHAPIRDLARAGYRSVVELANEGWRPTWPAARRLGGVLPLPPLVQIDHVLCGPRHTARGSRTVALPGSDHRGLVAEVVARDPS